MKYAGSIICLLATPFALVANPSPDPSREILQRYLEVTRCQQYNLRGLSMEVDINATLPKLKRTGRLSALRYISHLGKISYIARSFVGDNSIRKDVIARYLQAEVQGQGGGESLAITPENYKFKYRGLVMRDDRQVHVFQLSPRKKRVGLFKGELWIDPQTYLPVREKGRFVKNPSVFLKKVEFVRDYSIRDGMALPERLESVVYTRLVGPAEIQISFRNFSRLVPEQAAVVRTGGAADR